MIPPSVLREHYPDLPDDVIEMLSRIPQAGSGADITAQLRDAQRDEPEEDA